MAKRTTNALQTLPSDASTEAILQATDRDGACIIGDVLRRDLLARIDAEIAPFIEARRPVATISPDARRRASAHSSRARRRVATS